MITQLDDRSNANKKSTFVAFRLYRHLFYRIRFLESALKTLITMPIAVFIALMAASAQAASFLEMNQLQKNFYGKNFQQCQDELNSLGKMNGEVYKTDKSDLDSNVNSATRYLLLRPTLPPDITTVMDSIHQANISKVCQKIRQDLYAALLKEAENVSGSVQHTQQ